MTNSYPAPGPGSWALEGAHWTKPVSAYFADVFSHAMPVGFAACAEHYGMPIAGLDIAYVGHFMYVQIRPLGAPVAAKGPPPKWLFKLLLRLHPALRRRVRRSGEVFEQRLWRQEIDDWHRRIKPGLIERHLALQRVELERLDNPDLLDYLTACRDQAHAALVIHHRLFACTALPLGEFLFETQAWTGLPSADILSILRGASPATAGASAEANALRAALREDTQARDWLLAGPWDGALLDRLRAREGRVGETLNAYLDLVGNRLATGYDVADHRVMEVPEITLRGLALSLDSPAQDRIDEARVAAVRDRVPEAHREDFDRLLEEAIFTHEIRDERIMIGDAWATGLLRRALLETGRRMQAMGVIEQPEHLLDARHAEIEALMRGAGGPSTGDLAARHRQRCSARIDEMPAYLGNAPSPPPPNDWLPPSARRLMNGVGTFLLGNLGQPGSPPAGGTLHGTGASGGIYEGKARVVRSAQELEQVQQGEILVVPSTSPVFNVVLPLIGAIVTDRGGVLCHAAVVAREFGLPAVVGALGATDAIRSGDRLVVNGDTGEVSVS